MTNNIATDVETAIQKLADVFLSDIRPYGVNEGWGQYLRTPSRQVGLYGTCSGIICVSLAYGGDRLPLGVTQYINELWRSRSQSGSDGAKNYSLTARCAFLVLALRLADDQRLREVQQEATADLLTRINTDGLFKPWQVNANVQSHESSEVATALTLLSYTLAPAANQLPNDIVRSATALQERITKRQPRNEGVQNLLLLATGLALGPDRSSNLNRLIKQASIHEADEGQDTLDFWDYSWPADTGLEQRRDYMHVPATAVELLIATTSTLGTRDDGRARQLAQRIANQILAKQLFYGGREIATSKSQAWIALALHRMKIQLGAKKATESLPWYRRLLPTIG